jgi:phosphoglycerate dehydrogenase-like enzyme
MRTGLWQNRIGEAIAGKTIGVIGLGRLGQRVARVGVAFDARVLAWSTNLDPDLAASHGVEAVSKAQLLAESDVVTVHLKMGDRSIGAIGVDELRAMKPTAYLVNTSRGPIVEQDALVTALREGWIAGAALDVYDEEPLPPDHPLRTTPRTLLTPHIGYVVREGYELYYADALADIVAWQAGSPTRLLEP